MKLVNDSFGHVEGDKLIVKMANILQANCRETDILARTGGDEFSMFLLNSTLDNMYRHKMFQSKSLHSTILSSMKTILFEKNKETEEHAHRLIFYTKLIGKRK